MKMHKIVSGFMMLAAICFGPASQAAILLNDDFKTGSFDTDKWVFWDDGEVNTGNIVPDFGLTEVPEGSGNFAVQLAGNDGDYDEAMRSVMSFTRGANLRCTLTLWRGGFVFNPDELGIVFSGINGPWTFRQTPYPDHEASNPDRFPSLDFVEAGFLRDVANAPTNGGSPRLIWREGDNGEFNPDGAVIGPGFTTAFDNARGRDTAIKLRVYLGNQSGAAAEYSTNNGSTWSPVTILTEVDTSGSNPVYPVPNSTQAVNLDTRGSSAGDPAIYPLNPNTSKAYGENVVSGNNTVFVHFHSEFGTVFVDDVVVETDGGTNPTSTPTPTATATQVVNSVGMTWFLYQ